MSCGIYAAKMLHILVPKFQALYDRSQKTDGAFHISFHTQMVDKIRALLYFHQFNLSHDVEQVERNLAFW